MTNDVVLAELLRLAELTDEGLADEFVKLRGERFRHLAAFARSNVLGSGFIAERDGIWAMKSGAVDVRQAYRAMTNELLRQAADLVDPERQSEPAGVALGAKRKRMMKDLLDLVALDPAIAAEPDEFDPDPNLFACATP